MNETITELTEVFQIHHSKITPCHSQANGMVEAFNKFLEHALTKVCDVKRDDWDPRVPTVLWEYRTTCKKLMGYTPFHLVYGKEAVVPMDFLVPILRIATFTEMDDTTAEAERMSQLLALDEDRFIERFQQKVQKARNKAWHDQHIKHKIFQVGDLVLLYDKKFLKHPGKLRTHWLGPFVIRSVTEVGAVQLENMQGELHGELVIGSRLKLYMENSLPLPLVV